MRKLTWEVEELRIDIQRHHGRASEAASTTVAPSAVLEDPAAPFLKYIELPRIELTLGTALAFAWACFILCLAGSAVAFALLNGY